MSKKQKLYSIIITIIAGMALAVLVVLFALSLKTEKYVNDNPSEVYFANTSISDYIIVSHKLFSTKEAIDELEDYIEGKTGSRIKKALRGKDYPYTIRLIVDKERTSNKIVISGGKIILYGTDSKDCIETVRAFSNMYLDWAFAGEERAHVISSDDVYNPADVLTVDAPWIEKREPIICLWKTNVPRGQFYNTGASLKSEILTYSDDQLYEYVKLMKACGFTGIQVTDMCSAWAQYSGYEFVHDRLRFMADAAHSLGMDFTLWVWGAEFDGYGWYDETVVYHDYANYKYSFESPEAYATFDKYYSIYAELADCSDRVIVHYDDPSNIHNSLEIATYAKLLKEKFRAINPYINFGVSDYTDKYDKSVLKEELGEDVTVYSGAVTKRNSTWATFRYEVKENGLDLGVWSWNLCENEIDQMAEMNVNSGLIQNVYIRTMVDGDDYMVPSYWSEMDSYHLVNLFSLYCAGQLLQNPGQDSDAILAHVAYAVAGTEYGEDLYQILTIIEDARTGDSWETFKWGNDEYLLTSDSYPAESILERCNTYCDKLDKMIAADIKTETLPLPVSVSELLSLIRPHLEQIRLFAQFRVELNELKSMQASGKDAGEIEEKLDSLAIPIPNYDVLVGVWGQPESLAQYALLREFCSETGYEFPKNSLYYYTLKQYIYQEICAYQKKENERLDYYSEGSLWRVVIGEEALDEILEELVCDGLLRKSHDGGVYLVNWEDYVFAY